MPSEGPVTSWVDVRPHDTTEFYKVEIGYGGNTFITVFNDTPWDVFIEPFGLFLAPGEVVDIEVGYEVSHVVARRDFDGLILAEVDMPPGDVLVIQ